MILSLSFYIRSIFYHLRTNNYFEEYRDEIKSPFFKKKNGSPYKTISIFIFFIRDKIP